MTTSPDYIMPASLNLSAWRDIFLGTSDKEELLHRHLKGNMGEGTREILGNSEVKVAETETKVTLARVNVTKVLALIGSGNQNPYEYVCGCMVKYGAGICPAEVGLRARVDYNDQPKGENIIIGMKPIGGLNILVLGRENDASGLFWVRACEIDSIYFKKLVTAGTDWVFTLS